MCASRTPPAALATRWALALNQHETATSMETDDGGDARVDMSVAQQLIRLRTVLSASSSLTLPGQVFAWAEQCGVLFDVLCAAMSPLEVKCTTCVTDDKAGDRDGGDAAAVVMTSSLGARKPMSPCVTPEEVDGLWGMYCAQLIARMSTMQNGRDCAALHLMLVRQMQHYCLCIFDAATHAGRSAALHVVHTIAQALLDEVTHGACDAQCYLPPLPLIAWILQIHDAAASLRECAVHDETDRGVAHAAVRLVEVAHATLVQSYVSRLVHEVLFASYWAEASMANGPRVGSATRALGDGAVHCAVWSFFNFASLVVRCSAAFAVVDIRRVAGCVVAPLVIACADAFEATSHLPGLLSAGMQDSSRVVLYVRDVVCFVLLARLLQDCTELAPRHLLPACRTSAVEERLHRLLQGALNAGHGVTPSLAGQDVLQKIWNSAALTEDELLPVDAGGENTVRRPWDAHFVRASCVSLIHQLFA